jgi:hypothetical protein
MTAERHAVAGEGPLERVRTSRKRRSSAPWNGSSNSQYLRFYGLQTLLTTHSSNVLLALLFNEGLTRLVDSRAQQVQQRVRRGVLPYGNKDA